MSEAPCQNCNPPRRGFYCDCPHGREAIRLRALANMHQGPEGGSVKAPSSEMVVPTLIHVVRKGKTWVITCDVYIGDAIREGRWQTWIPDSRWANPFSHFKNHEESLRLYEEHIRLIPELWDALASLSGMVLGYCYRGKPRHGEVLQRLFRERYLSASCQ